MRFQKHYFIWVVLLLLTLPQILLAKSKWDGVQSKWTVKGQRSEDEIVLAHKYRSASLILHRLTIPQYSDNSLEFFKREFVTRAVSYRNEVLPVSELSYQVTAEFIDGKKGPAARVLTNFQILDENAQVDERILQVKDSIWFIAHVENNKHRPKFDRQESEIDEVEKLVSGKEVSASHFPLMKIIIGLAYGEGVGNVGGQRAGPNVPSQNVHNGYIAPQCRALNGPLRLGPPKFDVNWADLQSECRKKLTSLQTVVNAQYTAMVNASINKSLEQSQRGQKIMRVNCADMLPAKEPSEVGDLEMANYMDCVTSGTLVGRMTESVTSLGKSETWIHLGHTAATAWRGAMTMGQFLADPGGSTAQFIGNQISNLTCYPRERQEQLVCAWGAGALAALGTAVGATACAIEKSGQCLAFVARAGNRAVSAITSPVKAAGELAKGAANPRRIIATAKTAAKVEEAGAVTEGAAAEPFNPRKIPCVGSHAVKPSIWNLFSVPALAVDPCAKTATEISRDYVAKNDRLAHLRFDEVPDPKRPGKTISVPTKDPVRIEEASSVEHKYQKEHFSNQLSLTANREYAVAFSDSLYSKGDTALKIAMEQMAKDPGEFFIQLQESGMLSYSKSETYRQNLARLIREMQKHPKWNNLSFPSQNELLRFAR